MTVQKFDIKVFEKGVMSRRAVEPVAIESAVSITVYERDEEHVLVTTLCTPCDLKQMVLGFLFSEGLISRHSDVNITFNDTNPFQAQVRFVQKVHWKQSIRSFVQHGGCGLCSKAVLEKINKPVQGMAKEARMQVLTPSNIIHLYQQLSLKQPLFSDTGGTHAAALFDFKGKILAVYEDVGRHNAVDKAIGHALQNDWEIHNKILWVSGRAGFELVQKAVNANFAVMLSIGAPTSMAVELAAGTGLVLIGFFKYGEEGLSNSSYNIYNE